MPRYNLDNLNEQGRSTTAVVDDDDNVLTAQELNTPPIDAKCNSIYTPGNNNSDDNDHDNKNGDDNYDNGIEVVKKQKERLQLQQSMS